MGWVIRRGVPNTKDLLCAALILAYPLPGEKFILDSDASGYAIGNVLSQVVNGTEKVVGYYSRTLYRTEYLRRTFRANIDGRSRSFFRHQYQKPICARCDGLFQQMVRSICHTQSKDERYSKCCEQLGLPTRGFDQGRNFESDVFKEVYEVYGIKKNNAASSTVGQNGRKV